MSKPVSVSKMGAQVLFCRHDASFPADIFVHGDTAIIVANAEFQESLTRPAALAGELTHHIVDYPRPVYWSERRGMFIVARKQCTLNPAPDLNA